MSEVCEAIAPVALVTGGARRIGAHIVRELHGAGYRVVIHHGRSREEAAELAATCNRARPDSATTAGADLRRPDEVEALAANARCAWNRVDLLVNNASEFRPTPIGSVGADDWESLLAVNLRAPFFLAQALAGELARNRGAIVNITDIYADRPLPEHAPYCAAKAGLVSLTRSLAGELAPAVRVNAVAPGAILWPEGEDDAGARERLLQRVPLGSLGDPADIARAVRFLALEAGYVTGQVIAVDGGRTCVP